MAPAPADILLVTRIHGLEENLRELLGPELSITRTRTSDTTAAALATAQVVVADPPLVAALLHQAQNLKWLHSTYAGINTLLISDRRDYRLTRTTGIFGPRMAEYVLGHIISRERSFTQNRTDQAERRWNMRLYRRLSDITMAILGTGDIGAHVAKMAAGFGLRVLGLRRNPAPAPDFHDTFTAQNLPALLAQAHYIVNLLPSTPATRGLLSGERLAACRTGAVLINVGRGDVIDFESLQRALDCGWLAGAVLDVFPDEPLAADSPYWGLPNTVITPHVAALGFSDTIAAVCHDNIQRYFRGDPLTGEVNWSRGY